MEGSKRLADEASSALVPVKKAKQDGSSSSNKQLATQSSSGAIQAAAPARTSSLMAPVMLLEGHKDEVFTCKYNPSGSHIASAGMDRQIFLWNTFGECENFAVLPGHTGAVFDLSWSKDGDKLYSAGIDKTCIVWDAEAGARVRKLKGHSDFVNSCCASRHDAHTFVTGSDDGTVRVWDARRRGAVHTLNSGYQVMAVVMADDGERIISAGLDNAIKMWDLRTMDVTERLAGHTDTVTGLSLSPNGKEVLSFAMDNTARIWDVQPFAQGPRLKKTLMGAQVGLEKNFIKCAWTPDGKHVGCGSGDRNVYVWNVFSQKIAYCLPGHKSCVNQVDFHPEEPIVVSCSSDKKLFQGELHL
ncbi:U5 snRNP-specific protein [Salpingoeca rosetta]|uniref:U5 snRNP-specific protein n=1 Tax=Salpingoeca rosetta (strain ATCC 50818 / BSB-021) TaxID=946362 RepID=F2TZN8_SALR5|nr:U5 snRNP-specific protein [Salpingoeca rosetta]EGD79062.1 U5 snRNP-specific protein [Salpingoeca rosetta]|eukprot:XP_004998018.1 U5 snRNP-specific protein [Salpingoeca rosetta]